MVSGQEIVFLIFSVLGGLALFIFGMNVMTEGLRTASGAALRTILAKTSRSRIAGISFGTVLGVLIHSSAVTVMLVGFVNAGLMQLIEAIPPMLGANIGTSISMQLISFKLDEYCYFAIAVGFIIQMAAPNMRVKQIGKALLGFGLLFLGMKTMSGAIKPHRELLTPLLGHVDGTTLSGMLLGVLISTSITGIIQSSGATIAMCYALIDAGVFTQLPQVYPIVLGAHIGTCATAMLGSIGTNIQARRTAISHLTFNVTNVIGAIITAPLLFHLLPLTAHSLKHQVANMHCIIMLVASIIVLPLSVPFAKLIVLITPSRKPLPQPSFLDPELQARPEEAICASIRELRRVAAIAFASLRLNANLFFASPRKDIQTIKLNEKVINEIKVAMKAYSDKLTNRYLSRRQTFLIQHTTRCMADIERIGDHVDEFCNLSVRRNKTPSTLFDAKSFETLFDLYMSVLDVTKLVIDSLDPDLDDFQGMAKKILDARDTYVEKSINTKALFADKLAERAMTPTAAMFYSEYMAALDRIVKHSKTIALAESQPDFWIKRKKLNRVAGRAPDYGQPSLVNPDDFLDQLQSEEYL